MRDLFSRNTSALGGSSFGKLSIMRKLIETILRRVVGISSGCVPYIYKYIYYICIRDIFCGKHARNNILVIPVNSCTSYVVPIGAPE